MPDLDNQNHPSQSDEDSLQSRLEKVRARRAAREAQARSKANAAMGIGFRLSLELVVAVVVGSLLGYGIDRWLGTFPLALVIFFVIGAVAGVRNMLRAVKELSVPDELSERDGSKTDLNEDEDQQGSGKNDSV